MEAGDPEPGSSVTQPRPPCWLAACARSPMGEWPVLLKGRLPAPVPLPSGLQRSAIYEWSLGPETACVQEEPDQLSLRVCPGP
jgi:hypothetical protein